VPFARQGTRQGVVAVERNGNQVDHRVEHHHDHYPHEHVRTCCHRVTSRPQRTRGQTVGVSDACDAAASQYEHAEEAEPAARYHQHALPDDGLGSRDDQRSYASYRYQGDRHHGDVVNAFPAHQSTSLRAPVTLKFIRLTERVITKMITEMAEPNPYA